MYLSVPITPRRYFLCTSPKIADIELAKIADIKLASRSQREQEQESLRKLSRRQERLEATITRTQVSRDSRTRSALLLCSSPAL